MKRRKERGVSWLVYISLWISWEQKGNKMRCCFWPRTSVQSGWKGFQGARTSGHRVTGQQQLLPPRPGERHREGVVRSLLAGPQGAEWAARPEAQSRGGTPTGQGKSSIPGNAPLGWEGKQSFEDQGYRGDRYISSPCKRKLCSSFI